MLVELVLTVCMQAEGVECATFRQQVSAIECVTKIRTFENKYGYDPNKPPYLEWAECIKLEKSDG